MNKLNIITKYINLPLTLTERNRQTAQSTRRAACLFHPLLLLASLFIAAPLAAAEHAFDQVVDHPEIALLDEEGKNVLDSGKPYSPKQSCGSCHDYDSITHAYHFEMGRDEASDQFGPLRGMSQLSSPGYFGGYTCMGGNAPTWLAKKENATESDFADYGAAGWIPNCAGCHTGGGWMEKDRNGQRYDEKDPATVTALDGDYFNRGTDENNQKVDMSQIHKWDWKKSGVVEADCFMCHTDFSQLQDYNKAQPAYRGKREPLDLFTRNLRRSDLIDKGYFRYTPTAMLQYMDMDGSKEGIAEKPLVDFDRKTENGELILDADNNPTLTWNKELFDEQGKVVIPMLRFPANDNCMLCHRTSNSRRGFYGFGESAEAVFDEDGILQEDYQDDVHKGKTWVADNGEERQIENCNACHSRAYFRPEGSNTDLDADHNFLKGNSDMDVRNDLDNAPNATSCTYCHDEAKNPVIPSGHDSMLSAHRELWKHNGDMKGYLASNLDKVTQTHLDVVSCQACHITNKKSRGNPINPLYRYRRDGDNKQRITPYNAKPRYVWKDLTSGKVFSRHQRNSVFEMIDSDNCAAGGKIVNPTTKATIATVTARVSHGSCRYGDPETYEGFEGLQKAYNAVLTSEGVKNPNAVLMWGEMNNYVISHNSRPSPQALQCGECHTKKSSGSFSALISDDGVLGSANYKQFMVLPDKRLVKLNNDGEIITGQNGGIIQVAQPYIKMMALPAEEGGEIKYVLAENVSDILGATKLDGSMTVLGSDQAEVAAAALKKSDLETIIKSLNIKDSRHKEIITDKMASDEAYHFIPTHGNRSIQQVAVLVQANDQTDRIYPHYRAKTLITEQNLERAKKSDLNNLASEIVFLELTDSNNQSLSGSNEMMLVKIPTLQQSTEVENLAIAYSSDGSNWWEPASLEILAMKPKTNAEEGYVLFESDKLGYFALTDKSLAASSNADARDLQNAEADSAEGGSSGGGLIIYLLPLLLALRAIKFRADK